MKTVITISYRQHAPPAAAPFHPCPGVTLAALCFPNVYDVQADRPSILKPQMRKPASSLLPRGRRRSLPKPVGMRAHDARVHQKTLPEAPNPGFDPRVPAVRPVGPPSCYPFLRRRSARQALRHALRILLMSEPVESTNGNPFARTVGQPLSCGLSGLSARCHMGNRLPLDIIPVREEALRPL